MSANNKDESENEKEENKRLMAKVLEKEKELEKAFSSTLPSTSVPLQKTLSQPHTTAEKKLFNDRAKLYTALDKGDHALVRRLVEEERLSLETLPWEDHTLFHRCVFMSPQQYSDAASRCLSVLLSALGQNLSLAEQADSLGRSPLIAAAAWGRDGCLQAMARSGCDVNAQDPQTGMTALHYATRAANWDCVTELAKSGVDVERKDNQGQTAFDIAKSSANKTVYLNALEKGYQRKKTLEALLSIDIPYPKVLCEIVVEYLFGELQLRDR
eukprot:g74145.t1